MADDRVKTLCPGPAPVGNVHYCYGEKCPYGPDQHHSCMLELNARKYYVEVIEPSDVIQPQTEQEHEHARLANANIALANENKQLHYELFQQSQAKLELEDANKQLQSDKDALEQAYNQSVTDSRAQQDQYVVAYAELTGRLLAAEDELAWCKMRIEQMSGTKTATDDDDIASDGSDTINNSETE